MPTDPAKLRIVLYPDPVLRAKAKPIPAITDEVRAVAQRMLQLMHEAPGVGLAAPQVGLNWRLFVASPSTDPNDDMVFINPVLSAPGRELEDYEEGCLSIPQVTGEIRRPKAITVEAIGLDGATFRLTSDELPARVWQHEFDHLEGTLILDRMTPMDRMACERQLKELETDYHGKSKRR
ncbi:MAG: peptide deformylase [Planctomycetes bacterium]|nr:peptide deformylase [Planctomycetota bacterium]